MVRRSVRTNGIHMASSSDSVIAKTRSSLARNGLFPTLVRVGRGIRGRLHHWVRDQNAWLGRIVEWRGNVGRVGSLRFDLNNPAISTGLKGRFLAGSWEAGTLALLRDHVDPDLPVIEFGAGIGVVSCTTNSLLRRRDKHLVVEAQSALIPTIEKNRDLNGCGFSIRHGALAYGADHVEFWLFPGRFIGNSLQPKDGGIREVVPALQIQKVIDETGFDRITLIIDVEGTETEMVRNELPLLQRVVDTLIMEEHLDSEEAKARIEQMHTALREAGFTTVATQNWDVVYRNERFHAPPSAVGGDS